jgi:hypothetical protein
MIPIFVLVQFLLRLKNLATKADINRERRWQKITLVFGDAMRGNHRRVFVGEVACL